MKLSVINGPNINLLGIREPDLYGRESYKELLSRIRRYAEEKNIAVDCFQSNHEGKIVDYIQSLYGRCDGIVINPAAYTHTSVAIADALAAVEIPYVEVHITDPDEREDFRHISYIRPGAVDTIKGEGLKGYRKALDLLIQK